MVGWYLSNPSDVGHALFTGGVDTYGAMVSRGVIAVRRIRFGALGTPTQAATGGDNKGDDSSRC